MNVATVASTPIATAPRFGADLGGVTAFLHYEARLLDERRFEEWMALFEPTGFYWAPATLEQKSPLNEVSLFYDDRELMTQRITRLRHERIHSQIPPSRTVHLISNVTVEPEASAGKLLVRSNFLIAEYRPSVPEGSQRFFAGRYEHSLMPRDGGLQISSKKAVLVNCDSTFASMALYF